MIIILESEEDRIALAKTYNWIELEIDIKGIDYIDTKPIYDALIINRKKETTAQDKP